MNPNRQYNYNRSYNNGYRNGENRRYYQNRDQSQRPVWQERRGGYDSRNGGRPVSHDRSYQNNQSSQLPGIVVNKNPQAKPFEPNSSSNDGSGDKMNGNHETQVAPIAQKLADIDLNANDQKAEANAANTASDQSVALPQITADGSTGSQSDVKPDVKAVTSTVPSVPVTTPTHSQPRRNTIGESFSGRKPFIKNFGFGQKSYQNQGFNNANKFNKYDQNKRSFQSNYQSKAKAYPPPSQSADFVPHMAPINPYVYNGLPETCSQLTHYYYPNSFYPSVGYPLPSQMPANSVEFSSESAITQKNVDNDTNGKALDGMSSSSVIPMTPCFVPFVPSAALPEPPHYYGHIVTCKTDAGLCPFFICDAPNNIAPLQLEVNTSGWPVLPCNCHLLNITPGHYTTGPL